MTAALQERTLHLPGDGSVLKDFVFVGDVVRMAVQARRARTEGQAAIFVIGTGKPTSLLDLVAAVRQVTGVALKVEVGPHSRQDAVVSIGNPEKAFEQLHQMPEIQLHAGLELVFAGMASRR
jgi:UDP-glucose 4-epimerase